MSQSHNGKCWAPRKLEKLSPLQIKRAMRAVMFLTEKRDGTVKTRNCVDGSSMRVWMPKDDAASPTVGLASLMTTCMIDAHENRDVATTDTPNAFVQTDLTGETVIMKIKGELVGIPMEIDPNVCKDCIVYENNVPVLCLEALKASHGMSHSGL